MNRSTLLRTLSFFATAAFLGSCTLQALPEVPKPECSFNSDCASPKVCGAGGICMDQCREDRDCVDPLICHNGGCVPKEGQCREDRQCAADEKCTGGLCNKKCTTTAECGMGFTCLGGACISQSTGCVRDNECSMGKVCNSAGKCSAACLADTTCSVEEVCSGGACLPKPTACTGDGNCTAPETCGPDNTCSKPCNVPTDCPNGKMCSMNRCVPLPAACSGVDTCPLGKACVGMLCTDACVNSKDCSDGLVCSFGVCSAPGTGCLSNTDCTSGKACSPNGECVASCTVSTECASGEECSNGACVGTGPLTGKVVGTVTFTGLTDHSGITITLRGASNVQAVTGPTGAYSFAGLKPGRYTMVFNAPSTKEHEVSIDVAAPAGASTNGPAMAFTPVGELIGNIKLQGSNTHNGIQVVLVGKNLGTTTDTNGNFVLRDVPIGTHTLLASAAFYVAAQPMTVPVTYNMQATQPDIVLQPAPVTTGDTFSFVTLPATQAKVGQSYLYTATAGGGGVVGPTYAKVDGPGTLTIDPSSGVVSFTPTAGDIGSHYIILSATGGNATVYQIYYLTVSTPFTSVHNERAREIDTFGNNTWMTIEYQRKVLLFVDGGTSADGGPMAEHLGTAQDKSGPVSQVEVMNGGSISGVSFPGGALSAITGPVGTFNATWAGGTVNNWTSQDLYTLATKSGPGNVTSIKVVDGEIVTNHSYLSGPAQSFNDGRVVPTALTATYPLWGNMTGLASTVSATALTDTTATWAPGLLAGSCVTNAANTTVASITANTATGLTLSGTDATTFLASGQRYFVVNCGSWYGRFTATGNFGTVAVNALVNRRLDTYLVGQSVSDFQIIANSVTVAGVTTVTFEAPVDFFGELLTVPSNGFVVVSNPSNQHSVTVNDATAAFAGGLSATNRVAFDGNNSVYVITANTATSVTYTAPMRSLTRFTNGLTWRLTDTANRTAVTFTFGGTAAFTPAAYVGRQLFFDVTQNRYNITANTATTITALIDASQFPLLGWKSTWASVTHPSTSYPSYQVTDSAAAYGANALVNSYLYQVPNLNWRGTVYSNTATTFVISGASGTIRDLLAGLSGGQFMFANTSSYVRATLTFTPNPSWVVDSLVGREIFSIDNNNARGTILSNTANAVVVEYYYSYQSYFDTLGPTSKMAIAYLSGASSGQPGYRVTLNANGTAWAANAYAGMLLISPNGDTVGNVLSNTATQAQVVATNSYALNSLLSGQPFAFSNPLLAGNCGIGVGRISPVATLTGATLAANAYQNLYVNGRTFPVTGNTASALDIGVCGYDFDSLWQSVGQRGIATSNNAATLTLTNSMGTHPVNGLVGQRVVLYEANRISPPIISNTATSMVISFTTNEYNNLNAYMLPGSKYSVGNATGETVVSMVTSGLAVDALKSRFVQLFSNNTGYVARFVVDSNTATQLNVRLNGNTIDNVVLASPPVSGYLSSQGLVVRMTDSTASFMPNSLTGKILRLNGRDLEITANTATTITGSISDTYSWPSIRTATSYTVMGMNPSGPVAVLGDGDGIVASNDSNSSFYSIYRLRGNSVVAHYNRVTTSQALNLAPAAAPIRGVLTGGTSLSDTVTATDAAANWVPNAYAGSMLHVRQTASSTWYSMTILSNTATTLTAYRPSSGNTGSGYQYIIEPLRFTVAGSTLTANALVGQRIRINGIEHLVRSNTASEVVLSDLGANYYSDTPSILTGVTTGYVFNGLSGQLIRGLAREGATGLVAAGNDGLTRFNGTTWTRISEPESATAAGTGVISAYSYSQVMDSMASYMTDALNGYRMKTAVGIFGISGNSANTLYLNNSFSQTNAPLPGETFRMFRGDGFNYASDVSTGPASVWVTSNNGMHKLVGSAWTHYTRANTETMLNLSNGMFHDDPDHVSAVSDTEAWVSFEGYGAARLSGSTWSQFTRQGTESMAGVGDGLLSNDIYDFAFGPGGVVWFATDGGVSKLMGATWTNFGYTQGLPGSFSYDVTIAPNGETWASSGYSVVRLAP